MRLIDADGLYIPPEEINAKMAVACAPRIDTVLVRHGHWIFNPKDAIEMMFTLPKCSECGAESPSGGNYCPNCGARMLEVEDEEERINNEL